MISVNGSAARRAAPGDLLIIASFAAYEDSELASHTPKLVFVDERNQMTELASLTPVQPA
ncbi:Aspartate 1-decarboxylase precursor [compost metagenome]